jgi:environmental stress-induced protein Ves
MFERVSLDVAKIALKNEITVFVFNGEIEVYSRESHGNIEDFNDWYIDTEDKERLNQITND